MTGCSGSTAQKCECCGCCCPTLLLAPQNGKHRISLGGWSPHQPCGAIASKYGCTGNNSYAVSYGLSRTSETPVEQRIPPFYLQDDYEDEKGLPIYSPVIAQSRRWGDATESDKRKWMEKLAIRKGYPSCIAGARLGWYSNQMQELTKLSQTGQCYMPADVDLGYRRFCIWSEAYANVLPKGVRDVCGHTKA